MYKNSHSIQNDEVTVQAL